MARADEPTQPIGGHSFLDPLLELGRRGTAKVSTDADSHKQVGLDRTSGVLAILGLLLVADCRIGNPLLELGQRIEHFLTAIEDPDGLSAPLDGNHLTRRQDWTHRPQQERQPPWPVRTGACSKQGGTSADAAPNPSYSSRRDDQTPPAAIHLALFTHRADPRRLV